MAWDFDCIVVATDFSRASHAALRQALDLARRLSARVHIVHVAEAYKPNFPWSKANREAVERMAREEQTEAERRLAELVREPSEVEVVTKLLVAPQPHEAILSYCDEVDAGLLVVGTIGHAPLHELLVGSIAERCMRASTVPVLMVPPGAAAASETEEA